MSEPNKDAIKTWVAALRSGQYKQAKHGLKNEDGHYCCLGIACEISAIGYWKNQENDEGVELLHYVVSDNDVDTSILPNAVKDFYGLDTKNPWTMEQATLAGLNDSGKSFEYIASLLEQQYLV